MGTCRLHVAWNPSPPGRCCGPRRCEATGAIRAKERIHGRRTAIVALTVHAMTGDRDGCLAAGMDAYLEKPIKPADLAAIFAELQGGAGAMSESI